jgi:hypothetical protein
MSGIQVSSQKVLANTYFLAVSVRARWADVQLDKHTGHRKHFRPKKIKQLISEAGYTSEYDGRAGFPFFNPLPICDPSSREAGV